MKSLEQEVRALLHVAQQERKAALDRGRVDMTFQVGDQAMLRTKELLDAAEVGKLRPRWELSPPFPVAAVAGPNTYTLTLPARFKCSPTVNVDQLKPSFLRPGRPPSPGPVTGPVTDGRTRAGSSGASGAAAGGPAAGPVHPRRLATGRRPPPWRARSTRSSILPPAARAGSR